MFTDNTERLRRMIRLTHSLNPEDWSTLRKDFEYYTDQFNLFCDDPSFPEESVVIKRLKMICEQFSRQDWVLRQRAAKAAGLHYVFDPILAVTPEYFERDSEQQDRADTWFEPSE